MGTWLDAFLKQEPHWRDHPVHKVARHSIHFRDDDGIHAFCVGKPAFERNAGGVWVPVQESIIPRLWQKLAVLQSPEVRARMRLALSPFATTTDFACDTADGDIYGSDPATYATARSTASSYDLGAAFFSVGQLTVPAIRVYRGYVKFVTSGIGAGQVVTQANLKLVCTSDSSVTDFDVQIAKYTWASDPLSVNPEGCFDGALAAAQDVIWRNTSGISTNTQYASGNLDTTWIQMTGTTYYALLSSRDHDGSGTAPGGSEYIRIGAQENTTAGYRPVLTVVYSAAPTGQYLAWGKYW